MSRDRDPNWHRGAKPQVESGYDGTLSRPKCRGGKQVAALDASRGQRRPQSTTEGPEPRINEMAVGLAHLEFEEIS